MFVDNIFSDCDSRGLWLPMDGKVIGLILTQCSLQVPTCIYMNLYLLSILLCKILNLLAIGPTKSYWLKQTDSAG